MTKARVILPLMFMLLSAIALKSQSIVFNSFPSARPTVFLDFNGGTVKGTLWNDRLDQISAAPAGLDPAAIKSIHAAVAEYFVLFKLNISTDPAAYQRAPANQRIHIIVTPSGDWYGTTAGVSASGSFVWGDDTPGWVFTDPLNGNLSFIAAEIAHQIGHTLGLQHQCIYNSADQLITETSGGENRPLSNEAPVMGVPFYKRAVWITGPSVAGPATVQNDTAFIAGAPNNIGYRDPSPEIATNLPKGVEIISQSPETISVKSDDAFQYRLFDMNGRLLNQGSLQNGTNSISVPVGNAVSVLLWYNERRSGSEKFIH